MNSLPECFCDTVLVCGTDIGRFRQGLVLVGEVLRQHLCRANQGSLRRAGHGVLPAGALYLYGISSALSLDNFFSRYFPILFLVLCPFGGEQRCCDVFQAIAVDLVRLLSALFDPPIVQTSLV